MMWFGMEKALAALSVCEGGPRTTLTCQKKNNNNYTGKEKLYK